VRIVFTSLASYGHLYPLLPLAIAAREAGHDIVYATAAEFHSTLEQAGLEPAAAGMTLHEAFAQVFAGDPRERGEVAPDELNRAIGQAFGRLMPTTFMTDLAPLLADRKPDLVVYEMGCPGGAFAAHRAGIPAVAHGFGRVSSGDVVSAISAQIDALAAEVGLAGDSRRYWGQPFMDICPTSVQSPEFVAGARRVPLRPVGWSDSDELPAGIEGRDRSRPLVYLTLGSTGQSQAHLLAEAVRGLAALDADVLVATGPAVAVEALGEVPSNVRLESWVAQSKLLPHVDLAVHHGGSGTTLGAFSAGAPQLLLPQGADQFTNAEAVVAAGVGAQLIGDELTADAVRENAGRLLADSTVADAVRALADEVAAMPSPADIAAELPQYA
jgi:UDP:flavonoid glycosyltransferase YjiC (YdhE family)